MLLGGGALVYEMPSPLPTPFVPYCVKALDAVAGIMITASHNPRADNGYKLYAHDGAQIIPPDDEIVERHANLSPDVKLGQRASLAHVYVATETIDDYRKHMLGRFGVGASDLAITYTPMHGVGGGTMAGLFRDAGYGRGRTRRVPVRTGRDAFRRWPSPIPKSLARSISPSTRRTRQDRRSSSPTTPTPTGSVWRCAAVTSGECCAVTRSVGCSRPRSSKRRRSAAPRWRRRSCPRRCWRRSVARRRCRARRRSRDSSGSRGRPVTGCLALATKRRSGTPWIRWFRTRTDCPRRSRWRASRTSWRATERPSSIESTNSKVASAFIELHSFRFVRRGPPLATRSLSAWSHCDLRRRTRSGAFE